MSVSVLDDPTPGGKRREKKGKEGKRRGNKWKRRGKKGKRKENKGKIRRRSRVERTEGQDPREQ